MPDWLDEQVARSAEFLDGMECLMSKRAKSKKDAPVEEVVAVPMADELDDETFLKHLDARHSHEVNQEKALAKSPHIMEAWVRSYRAFHQRLHDIAAPGQHDHTHEEDW